MSTAVDKQALTLAPLAPLAPLIPSPALLIPAPSSRCPALLRFRHYASIPPHPIRSQKKRKLPQTQLSSPLVVARSRRRVRCSCLLSVPFAWASRRFARRRQHYWFLINCFVGFTARRSTLHSCSGRGPVLRVQSSLSCSFFLTPLFSVWNFMPLEEPLPVILHSRYLVPSCCW